MAIQRTLIANAEVVTPTQTTRMNVVIEDGTIAALDLPASGAAGLAIDETIDASGLILLPGVVDDQVHFREPGLTHKEDLTTGSRACAAGGVTTFLEMPNTNPTTTDQDALDWKYARAAEVCAVNFGFYVGATPTNVDFLRVARRAVGIKIFIGSSTGNLLVDDQATLERIFAETALPIAAHCEDEATVRANAAAIGEGGDVSDHSRVRDHRAAVVATARACELARRHRHRFHVLHVSTADELPILRHHERVITAEACMHHFLFTIDDYDRLGSRVQMNPSVKTTRDAAAIWQALLDGGLQVVATDHAPHTLEEKAEAYPWSPSGLPAVENSLGLMVDRAGRGMCTYQQIAHWMSDAPARVWDLVGKGRIEVGYDADLVLVDPNRRHEIRDEHQFAKSRWSPWHGETCTGWPVRTIVGGRTVYSVMQHAGPITSSDRGLIDDAARGQAVTTDHERGGYWATA